jgi:hypothetical protein
MWVLILAVMLLAPIIWPDDKDDNSFRPYV